MNEKNCPPAYTALSDAATAKCLLKYFAQAYTEMDGSKPRQISNYLDNLKQFITTASTDGLCDFFRICISILENGSTENGDEAQIQAVKALLQKHSYIFKDRYPKDAEHLVSFVQKLNNLVDLSQCPRFSIDPMPALYGVQIENEQGKTFLAPLDDDDVEMMIDVFVATQKHHQAGEWIRAVLGYQIDSTSPNQKDRKTLIQNVTAKICAEKEYKNSVFKYLTGNNAEALVKLCQNSTLAAAQCRKYQDDNQQLKTELEKQAGEKTAYIEQLTQCQTRITNYKGIEQENRVMHESIRELEERLDLQRSISEGIEKRRREDARSADDVIDAMKSDIAKLTLEITDAQKNADALNIHCQNLSSDLEVERERTKGMAARASEKECKLRQDLIGDFICAIKEQFNHFFKALDGFHQSSEYDEESVSICLDDIQAIIQNLKGMGAVPIGNYNETVQFDRAKHHCEEKLTEGTPVRIVNIGWAVGETVIDKAEVERNDAC